MKKLKENSLDPEAEKESPKEHERLARLRLDQAEAIRYALEIGQSYADGESWKQDPDKYFFEDQRRGLAKKLFDILMAM